MADSADNTPVLTTERLRMRPPCERDVDDVYEIYSDLHALKYFAREPLEDREDAVRMVPGR
jgi:RimJ/RimL family protein N-acetyltransferase